MCVFQESIIDLESDLEEQKENEQRWASKHKRALDQVSKQPINEISLLQIWEFDHIKYKYDFTIDEISMGGANQY